MIITSRGRLGPWLFLTLNHKIKGQHYIPAKTNLNSKSGINAHTYGSLRFLKRYLCLPISAVQNSQKKKSEGTVLLIFCINITGGSDDCFF